ncbi:Hypothetical_protein [Hexamita inflata]|uniref:Hypothetical_protein n=1 Tax=Hexamita inflata TaxID=28002 RepID=A0ABP1JEH0_9EUKA
MFKYRETYDKITVKYNDGEKLYTEKSLMLESTAYKEIQICGYNNDQSVKEYFIMPNVYNINRLFLDQCVVDLSALTGNFGTVEINRCSIIGSLTENLFANIFSVSIYDVLDIRFSQLISGRIKNIDIQINNINQDLDLRGANYLYGRLSHLGIYSQCVNLAQLEGHWNYVEISDCSFINNVQINTFGAKTLCFYQPSQDVFLRFSSCEILVLDLSFTQTPLEQVFDFSILRLCAFVKTINLNVKCFQIDLNQITGSFNILCFAHCTFQGSISKRLNIDQLRLVCCALNSEQLNQFSCRSLELRTTNGDYQISDLPKQLQQLHAYGISINIKNLKQYLRLSEIELEDGHVENLSFVNVPNIKSLKLNGCKSSEAAHKLQNVIKRKQKTDIKLAELKKDLQLALNYKYSSNRQALQNELTELIQFDISQITRGRE